MITGLSIFDTDWWDLHFGYSICQVIVFCFFVHDRVQWHRYSSDLFLLMEFVNY